MSCSNWRSTCAVGLAGRPDHGARRGTVDVVEGHDGEAPGQVDRLHRRHRDARRGRRDEDLGQRRSRSSSRHGHEEVVRLRRPTPPGAPCRKHEVVPVALGPRRSARHRARTRSGSARTTWRSPRRRAGPPARRAPRPCSLSAAATTLVDGQRPRRGVAAELVGDQAEVDQARAADGAAAVLLAHQQRGPPQLGAPAPVGRVEAAGSSRSARNVSGGTCSVRKRSVVSRKNS